MQATTAGDALVQDRGSPANSCPAGYGASSSNINAPGAHAQEQEGTLGHLGLKLSLEHMSSRITSARSLGVHEEYTATLPSRSIRSRLPPTPPSQEGQILDEPLLSPSMLSDAYHDALSSPRFDVSTPVHLTGPPTPDTTPPRTRQVRPSLKVLKSDLYHFSSLSQAESFVTARETLHSRSSHRSHSFHLLGDGAISARSLQYRYGSTLGMASSTCLDGATDLPGPRNVRVGDAILSRPDSRDMRLERLASPSPDEPATQESTDAQKNETANHVNGYTYSIDSATSGVHSATSSEISPKLKPREAPWGDLQTHAQHSSDNLPQREVNDPNSSHDALYSHLRDQKSKRLSGHSISSTLIEAMVYSQPTKPHKGLRHTGKNLDLRDAKCDSQRSRTSPAATTVAHEHRLRHSTVSLSTRSPGARPNSTHDEKPRSVSSPEALREKHFDSSLQSDTSSPQLAIRTLSGRAKRLTPPDWPLRSTTVNARNGMDIAAVAQPLSKAAWRPVKPAHPTEHTDDEDEDCTSRESSPDMHFPRHNWRRSQGDNELFSPARDPSTSFGTRPRTDSLDLDEGKFVQLGPNSRSDNVAVRRSLDSSRGGPPLSPPTASGIARLYSPAPTSLSQRSGWSDHMHQAEVTQARAVNIYPHHNESLLLVQHHVSAAHTTAPSTADVPRFEAVLDTGTPPPATSTVDPDTSNQQTTLVPPTIFFVPATPASEPDRQLSDSPGLDEPFSMNATPPLPGMTSTTTTAITTAPPSPCRTASLRQRARAQSAALVDALIHPLRHGSVSRRRRNTVAEERPRNLDPFWRPRGFWDDFDSDTEDDEDGDEWEPLPAGGDGRDVHVQPAAAGTGDAATAPAFPRRMSVRSSRRGWTAGNETGVGKGLGRGLGLFGSSKGRGRSWVPGQEGTIALGVRRRRSERALRTGGVLMRGKAGLGFVGVKVRGLREWGGRIREERRARMRNRRRMMIGEESG